MLTLSYTPSGLGAAANYSCSGFWRWKKCKATNPSTLNAFIALQLAINKVIKRLAIYQKIPFVAVSGSIDKTHVNTLKQLVASVEVYMGEKGVSIWYLKNKIVDQNAVAVNADEITKALIMEVP